MEENDYEGVRMALVNICFVFRKKKEERKKARKYKGSGKVIILHYRVVFPTYTSYVSRMYQAYI